MLELARWVSWVLLVGSASAQTVFGSELNGAQETPPVASGGVGTGQVVLDPLTGTVRVELAVSGTSGAVTAAHIHRGALGNPGGIAVPLTGVGPVWSESATLSGADVAMLLAGDLYFNVHTSAFPGGELRGQITPARDQFAAYATGAKEVPSTASPGVGLAEFTITPSSQLNYRVLVLNTTGTITGAHVHEGAPGTNGPIIFTLASTGPTLFGGFTAPLTELQRAKLRAGRYYLNIHTSMNPGGEIRGQLTGAFTPYGSGCPGASGVPSLVGGGTPVPSPGAFSVNVDNGVSLGAGALLGGGGAGRTPIVGCELLLNPGLPIVSSPVGLSSNGSIGLFFSLPAPIPTGWLSLQYVGLDPGAPNGALSMSNGLAVQLID